jgi:hypothetical protein
MNLVTAQRQSLQEIRTLLGKFVRAEIESTYFIPKYKTLFAPFDPPDLVTQDLSKSELIELDLYIEIMGGWFGEKDDLIPKISDWKYGENTLPYSWIDTSSYRKWILSRAAENGIDL